MRKLFRHFILISAVALYNTSIAEPKSPQVHLDTEQIGRAHV